MRTPIFGYEKLPRFQIEKPLPVWYNVDTENKNGRK